MKILFSSLNTFGFINPLIGLAKHLRSLTHEVAFVCDPSFTAHLQRQGLDRIPQGDEESACFLVERFTSPALNENQINYLESALTVFPADVLVTSPLALGPLIVAERNALPVAVMGFMSYLWSTPTQEANTGEDMRLLYDWRTSEMMEHLNKSRLHLGLAKLELDKEHLPFVGDLWLQRCTPSMAKRQCDFPKQVTMVGACLWPNAANAEANPEFELWLSTQDAELPLIYVSHGRTFQQPKFWDELKQAFRDKPCLVVASVDRMECEVGALPNNFYVDNYLAQSAVLPRTSLVIANGNSTVTLGALEQGIPMLLIPSGAETVDNAALCQQLGVAERMQSDLVDSYSIWQIASELMSGEQYKHQSERYAKDLAQLNGFESAANAVLELAASRAQGGSNRQDLSVTS